MTTRENLNKLHADRRQRRANKDPTQFGGEAKVTNIDGGLYTTASGCLWTLVDGVLYAHYDKEFLDEEERRRKVWERTQ